MAAAAQCVSKKLDAFTLKIPSTGSAQTHGHGFVVREHGLQICFVEIIFFHSLFLLNHSSSDTKQWPHRSEHVWQCLCAGYFPVCWGSPHCLAGTTTPLYHLIPQIHLPLPSFLHPAPSSLLSPDRKSVV